MMGLHPAPLSLSFLLLLILFPRGKKNQLPAPYPEPCSRQQLTSSVLTSPAVSHLSPHLSSPLAPPPTPPAPPFGAL